MEQYFSYSILKSCTYVSFTYPSLCKYNHKPDYHIPFLCCYKDKWFEDGKLIIVELRSKGIIAIGVVGFCWGGQNGYTDWEKVGWEAWMMTILVVMYMFYVFILRTRWLNYIFGTIFRRMFSPNVKPITIQDVLTLALILNFYIADIWGI